MQPYKRIHGVLTSIAVCAPPDDTSSFEYIRCILTGATILTILILLVISCFTATIHSQDFKSSLKPTSDTVATSCTIFNFLMGFVFRERLKRLFWHLQQNYEQCSWNELLTFWNMFSCILIAVKNDKSAEYFQRADKTSEKITTILVAYVIMAVSLSFSMGYIWSVVVNFHQDGFLDSEKLYHPYAFPYVLKKNYKRIAKQDRMLQLFICSLFSFEAFHGIPLVLYVVRLDT